MAKVGKLSASKIGTYKGCSLAYFLQYVEHVKVPESVRLTFGKAIHYMLNIFYSRNFKSPETFAKFWRHHWFATIAGEYLKGRAREELKVEEIKTSNNFNIKIGNHITIGPEPIGIFFGYMKVGENILRNFYSRHKFKPHPFAKERQFGMKKDELIEINGHPIRGIFDRIDQINGDWYITDYKTNKLSPEKDSFILHRNPQFTIYSYAFRQIFKREEKAILYYHLRSGKPLKTHRSEKDYDYLKSLVDEVAEGIIRNNFVPFYGFHCNFCDYKVACEGYSIPHHGGPRIDLEGKIIDAETFEEWDVEVPNWMESQEE